MTAIPTPDPAAGTAPPVTSPRRAARASVPGGPATASPRTAAAGGKMSRQADSPTPSPDGTPGPETAASGPAVRVRASAPAGAAHASQREADSAAPDRTRAIAAAMSEDRGHDSLDAHVRRYIADLGLWGFHVEKSLDVNKGRKNVSARGWPDWTILGTRILHRELKTERGKVSDEQEDVGRRIRAAGGDWDVWRPRDLLSGRIVAELRANTAGPLGLGGAA